MTTQRGATPAFTPRRRMVGWFDPRILALTGWQAAVAQVFGTYLDKREIEALLDENLDVRSSEDEASVGIDYVADVGDGFDPTYAVAWHLAKDRLEVAGDSEAAGDEAPTLVLPRGDYLVLGGDEVYPSPSRERYLNQTIGPYAAAFPSVPAAGPRPQLLALPGNHDWYDGLSLFTEQFCTAEGIGGWRLPQGRSYFAVRLPHGWWLWGVDAGLGGHIDPPQMRYFTGLDVQPGDRIILCWAAPTWTEVESRPGEHELLSRFVAEVVTGTHRAVVPLYLSGDHHHFAHYRSDDDDVHWITSGGGGAFLHPTHHLDDHVVLPGPDGAQTRLSLQGDPWPTRQRSRRMLGRLLIFPRYNPSFLLFTAWLHLQLAWAIQFGLRQDGERAADAVRSPAIGQVWDGFVRNPVSLLLGLLVVAGFAGFAKPPVMGRNGYRVAGLVHGSLHIVLALLLVRYASGSLAHIDTAWRFTLAFLVVVATAGGLLSGVLVGLYLGVTNLALKMHDNEAFSALHHEGFKHFLRLRVDETGVTLRVIGLEKVGRDWETVPAHAAEPPCQGAGDVQPRCIRTIRIPGAGASSA